MRNKIPLDITESLQEISLREKLPGKNALAPLAKTFEVYVEIFSSVIELHALKKRTYLRQFAFVRYHIGLINEIC